MINDFDDREYTRGYSNGYFDGKIQERQRWTARLERLRGAYAQAQKWNDRDNGWDRGQERALATAIDIMSGEDEVKP